ncbi:MAG: alpha/beta fold hydrolase, partial [Isosphaeraceae bacterium]
TFVILTVLFGWTESTRRWVRAGEAAGGLPRKAMLGAALEPVSPELRAKLKLPDKGGAAVVRPLPGSPAESAGLKPGDVIQTVDGANVSGPADVIAAVARRKSGDRLELGLRREGKDQAATARLEERPRKKGDGFEVIYDSVTSNGHRQRTIVTRPTAEGRYPAILLIQGLGNFSIDQAVGGPLMSYDRMFDELTRAGYVVMKVDKPGCGDSEGGPWPEIDFQTELDGYRQGLKALKDYPFVDPDKVFIFGHSMGGVMAPLLAAETKVKGVAVYGTVFRTWFEYQVENVRRQTRLAGADFSAVEQAARNETLLLSELYLARKSPTEVASAHPELRAHMNESIKDDRYMFGVNYKFFQQLADLNVPEAWAKTDAHVLALWGKGDYVAPGPDHEMIAEAVNDAHPGHGTYRALDADHGFNQATGFKDSFERAASGKPGEFNPAVLATLKDWMDQVRSK